MTPIRAKTFLFGLLLLSGLGGALPASAEDDYCRWGGDNGQSIRCFDCMQREWTGYNWRLVNTCKTPHFFFFGAYDWR